VVDRQFNPRRYDAAQAIQSFSARLRDQIGLDTVTSELVAVVQPTMQPTQASIWLRLGSAPTPRHQPGDNCHRGSFMSRKRISSAQTRSASTRLHDPDQTTPAQQIRELLRVDDRLISVAVVYARSSAVLSWGNAGQRKAFGEIYQDDKWGSAAGRRASLTFLHGVL
jgi:hypothetical protein